MGFRFRKSVKVAPGVRVNIGKRGVSSVSVGGRGARVNVNRKGVRNIYSARGAGLSYSTKRARTGCGPCVIPIVAASIVSVALCRAARRAVREDIRVKP